MIQFSGTTTLVPFLYPQAVATSESATTLTSTVIDGTNFCGTPSALFGVAGTTLTGTVVSTIATSDPSEQVNTRSGADTTDVVLRNGAADNITVGVKFSPTSASCTMKDCWLRLKRAGTIAAGKYVKLEIQTDNSGVPSNTAIATAATLDPVAFATTYSMVQFSFATPVDLSSASTYHFVLSGDYSASSSNHVKLASETVASGGTLSLYDSSWDAVATNTPIVWATGYAWTTQAGVTKTTSASMTQVGFNAESAGNFYRAKAVVTPATAASNRAVSVSLITELRQGLT